jgi:hypothetical protein
MSNGPSIQYILCKDTQFESLCSSVCFENITRYEEEVYKPKQLY